MSKTLLCAIAALTLSSTAGLADKPVTPLVAFGCDKPLAQLPADKVEQCRIIKGLWESTYCPEPGHCIANGVNIYRGSRIGRQ